MLPSKIAAGPQRVVLARLLIDTMRSLHGTYAPADEPFDARLATFFIGFCVLLGDIEKKPFSATKIAAYMRAPRTTMLRRLDRLTKWGLIRREGRLYYMQDRLLNSLIGMRSYKRIRQLLNDASYELSILDTLGD